MTSRTFVSSLITAIACGLLAFSPTLRAVTPAPDGGYSGNNTAEGEDALFKLTTGTNNNAIGFIALFLDTTGGWNTAEGSFALFNNSSGNFNTALGWRALVGNNTGSNNIGIGINAGANLNQGNNNNIDIGNKGDSADFNTIRIGTEGLHHFTFVAGINGTFVTGSPVCVDSTGELGECAAAGSPTGMNDKKLDDQAARIAAQEKVINALTATIKEQAAQIQKVSAEVAVMKAKPQLVSNQK